MKLPKFSVGRMLGAVTFVAVGFGVMASSFGPSAFDFAAMCIVIGGCFGAAVGLIVDRPILCTLIGAGLWLLFALYATLA